MSPIDGASILITGGTGSFGRAFLRSLLDTHNPARVVVFSRDELKQLELRQQNLGDSRLRFFIGDVRDLDRLRIAMFGVDTVIHAAALKQVDTAEYNPSEYVRTNILGSENVLRAAVDAGVKRVIALSTDKASSPINLYGATKLVSDKLMIAGNHYAAGRSTRISVVRYGNVVGSRGSVVPFFLSLAREGKTLPVTDERMTRFWLELESAVEFVTSCLACMEGGELFVPKIPSIRILDLVEAIRPSGGFDVVGIRPGEKLHEEMIAPNDSFRTHELTDRYLVLPTIVDWGEANFPGVPVREGFSYTSDNNPAFLSVDEIRNSISAFMALRD